MAFVSTRANSIMSLQQPVLYQPTSAFDRHICKGSSCNTGRAASSTVARAVDNAAAARSVSNSISIFPHFSLNALINATTPLGMAAGDNSVDMENFVLTQKGSGYCARLKLGAIITIRSNIKRFHSYTSSPRKILTSLLRIEITPSVKPASYRAQSAQSIAFIRFTLARCSKSHAAAST